MTIFSLLLFFESSFPPAEQLYIVYLENTSFGVLLFLLLKFAYYFPTPDPKLKNERYFALFLMGVYALWEAGFAVWRFILLKSDRVVYRPDYVDYVVVIGLLWVIFVFARNAIRNWNIAASRRFVFIFIIPLYLGILNALRTNHYVSTSAYHINMSVGILFTMFFFVLNYLTFQAESTSFMAKFSGALLTSSLAVFGIISWVVTPIHAQEFTPAIVDHRTLHFLPNDIGGYTVTEIPFAFDSNLGVELPITDSNVHPSEKVNFPFPFFGQDYQEIYIANDGAIGIGDDLSHREYQLHFTQTPAIFPLLVDLNPENDPDGGIFVRSEFNRMVITYYQVRAFYQPQEIYTFQVVLYHSGAFDITYNGLPESIHHHLNDRPESAIWAIGVKPSQAPQEQANFLNLPIESGPQGIIQDEYISFRQYLHRFLFPLTIAIFLSSLFLLMGIPLVIHYGIGHPLDLLLAGVQTMNQGKLDVVVPVQFNDEIGYLTNSFNNLSGELNGLIKELENRVAERTSDLVAVNEELRNLSVVVEQSPSSIVITDIDASIEYVNPAFTRSTGYSFEEVRGQNPRILKSGLTPPETYDEMWTQLTAGKPWRGELINKKKNADIFWENTVIAPILDESGNIIRYAAIKEDITARKLVEQALRESEEQYRLLFDLESDAIFIIRNEDGQILEANTAASALYGYTRGELLARKNTDMSAEPESTRKATNTSLPSDQVIVIPLRYHRKKDGSIFPVEITARFITWEGQPVHIAAIRDITERRKVEDELVKLSISDPLTELANRRYFFIQAEQIFSRPQRPDDLAILMVDIDHFKVVNDTYGHAAGDTVLRQLANRLNQHLRPRDILARYGGEEFVILLPRTPSNEAEQIAKRLCKSVGSKPFEVDRDSIHVTLSIGVAELEEDTQGLDNLMRYADQALYQAKQAGRNQWAIWKRNA
ncbi:MAG: diguanylate cyclase [Chloroflexi bacterium]|nr:diguanylate cyclase [Chloroflexota bacterium]